MLGVEFDACGAAFAKTMGGGDGDECSIVIGEARGVGSHLIVVFGGGD